LKMRKILFPLFFIFCMGISYGWIAGETKEFSFGKCSMLEVKIVGDEGVSAWRVEPACQKSGESSWSCSCWDNYVLRITPPPNFRGKATITIINYYPYEKEIEVLNVTVEKPYFVPEPYEVPKIVNQTIIKYYEDKTKIKELQARIDNLLMELNLTKSQKEELQNQLKSLNSTIEDLSSTLDYYKEVTLSLSSRILSLQWERNVLFWVMITFGVIAIFLAIYAKMVVKRAPKG